MLQTFLHNVMSNMFKPLLLFFYAGFLIPILRVKFEFPKVLYQGLTIYLLLAIGWHGGSVTAPVARRHGFSADSSRARGSPGQERA